MELFGKEMSLLTPVGVRRTVDEQSDDVQMRGPTVALFTASSGPVGKQCAGPLMHLTETVFQEWGREEKDAIKWPE